MKKTRNLIKLNPFSLDKIKKIKKNPIVIKNASTHNNNNNNDNIKPRLNISIKKKNLDNFNEKSFLCKTLNNFRKTNSSKDNMDKSFTQNNKLLLTNNRNYDDIISAVEKELKIFNSDEHFHNIVKIFETYQKELIYQLEGIYDNFELKNILKKNCDNIINYIVNYFSSYEIKYSKCLISLKTMN